MTATDGRTVLNTSPTVWAAAAPAEATSAITVSMLPATAFMACFLLFMGLTFTRLRGLLDPLDRGLGAILQPVPDHLAGPFPPVPISCWRAADSPGPWRLTAPHESISHPLASSRTV